MFRFKRNKFIVVVGAVVAVAIAGAAYAYFTSTGTGTGSATVGSAVNWTVAQSGSTGGALLPDASIGGTGAHIQTKAYAVTNPATGIQSLNQVVISVANADGTAWSSQTNPSKPACTASDFSVGGQAVGTAWTDTALAGPFAGGQAKTTGSVTVQLIDNQLNQDNCQGLTVPLYFSAS